MLMKILMLALVFGATYWYVTRDSRNSVQAKPKTGSKTSSKSSSKQKPKAISKNLKACEYCGVNIPESEGLEASGHFFCSEEHAQAHLNKTK